MTRATALLVAVTAAAGCGPDPSSARGTAERFLDAHYVTIRLQDALAYTAGLARSKVEREMHLTEGQEAPLGAERPVVRYRLVEEHADGEHAANFVYLASIAAGGDRFEWRWLVTVRRQDGGWRVTNYEELMP